MRPTIIWTRDVDIDGTVFRGALYSAYAFEHAVALLIAMSGQDPTAGLEDRDKVMVEFTGRYRDAAGIEHPFRVFDYKENRRLNLGGRHDLPVIELRDLLLDALDAATPIPWSATGTYYTPPAVYQWPARRLAIVRGSSDD